MVADFGGDLECKTDRRQRGNQGAIPVGEGTREEMPTIESADTVINPHPSISQLLQLCQVRLGDIERLKRNANSTNTHRGHSS